MAGNSSNEEIVYEEFEPYCKWQRNEDRDVLEIQLQDFKKEQLKVQISDHGVLKISGERALDPQKRSKFYKEVPAPAHKYNTQAIHAKFVGTDLIITLPKPNEKLSHPQPSKVDQVQCQLQPTKTAASLAATAVAVVVLAAYVRFMYKSTVDDC